jgi:hypothetical protein
VKPREDLPVEAPDSLKHQRLRTALNWLDDAAEDLADCAAYLVKHPRRVKRYADDVDAALASVRKHLERAFEVPQLRTLAKEILLGASPQPAAQASSEPGSARAAAMRPSSQEGTQ